MIDMNKLAYLNHFNSSQGIDRKLLVNSGEEIAAGNVTSALQEAENGSGVTTGQVIKDLITKYRQLN